MRVALKVAYDGESFHGYARQPKLKTVEGDIIDSLIKTSYIENPKDAVFRSASRTDKGVSSFGNVVAFNTEKNIKNLLKECNEELDDIIIFGIKEVDVDFYPRFAKQRVYQYYLKKHNFKLQAILSTVKLFIGMHNFSNFARIEPFKDPERTIEDIKLVESSDFYILEFYAQTYLWHQIRRTISAIIKVEIGKISQKDIKNALNCPEERVDFGLADSAPLILNDVLYDFSFIKNDKWEKKKEEMKENLINRIRCLF